jgi:pyrophosphate--fructose-6-phosphate 1-phosphotransferase
MAEYHVGGVTRARYDIHAVLLPELPIDIAALGARLRAVVDKHGNANVFLSEGAGVDDIIAEKRARGEEVEVDAFGHARLETINPGAYFAERLKGLVGAEKVSSEREASEASTNGGSMMTYKKS